MSFTFGGPHEATVVSDETAADRFDRDIANRGGDQTYTYDGSNIPTASVDVDSRNERDFYARQDDRNERVYVGPSGETPLADAADADKAEDVTAGHEVD